MKSKIHEHLQNNRNSESKRRIQMLLLITFLQRRTYLLKLK